MTCADCGEREAAVFIRRSGGGTNAGALSLCGECARSRGIIAGKGRLDIRIEELIVAELPEEPGQGSRLACPACGTELSALLDEGRLGCSACADAFRPRLLERMAARGASRGGARELPARGQGARHGGLSQRRDASHGSSRGAVYSGATQTAPLHGALVAALEAEDYERAALLRDEIAASSAGTSGEAKAPIAATADAVAANAIRGADRPSSALFPCGYPAFSTSRGREDDVVLSSSALACRDLEGVPFPGSPRGGSVAYRELLLEILLSFPEWSAARMDALCDSTKRSLAERGFVPRSYAADGSASLAASAHEGIYALIGDIDHLRLRSRRSGLDPQGAARLALAIASRVEEGLVQRRTGAAFASRPGIGWICARAEDCGSAFSVSATFHIPALVAAGLHQRLFRAILAEGVAIRGLYSGEEDSAGAVYELVAEGLPSGDSSDPASGPARGPAGEGGRDAVAAISAMARALASAERRARSDIMLRDGEARLDLEARAFGLASNCRLLEADEAARLVSVLRLAALSGRLHGADPSRLGTLLESLGPASLAAAAGLAEPPSGKGELSLRAAALRFAISGAEYRPEEQ